MQKKILTTIVLTFSLLQLELRALFEWSFDKCTFSLIIFSAEIFFLSFFKYKWNFLLNSNFSVYLLYIYSFYI